MKITVVSLLAIIAFAVTSFAADVIEFPASLGKVSFPHKKHQVILKGCIKCHETKPGKIIDFGKDWVHRTCKGCHSVMKKGPTSCRDCHNM